MAFLQIDDGQASEGQPDSRVGPKSHIIRTPVHDHIAHPAQYAHIGNTTIEQHHTGNTAHLCFHSKLLYRLFEQGVSENPRTGIHNDT
ncbi:hypothetical protein D3C71_1772530 [compost metagenome]